MDRRRFLILPLGAALLPGPGEATTPAIEPIRRLAFFSWRGTCGPSSLQDRHGLIYVVDQPVAEGVALCESGPQRRVSLPHLKLIRGLEQASKTLAKADNPTKQPLGRGVGDTFFP